MTMGQCPQDWATKSAELVFYALPNWIHAILRGSKTLQRSRGLLRERGVIVLRKGVDRHVSVRRFEGER
jgi:hypothetical protein